MQNTSIKKLGLVVLGLIILGGIGYGGYRLLHKETPDNNKTPEPTYTWQTYHNEELGFSFEYPDFWTEEQLEARILTGTGYSLGKNASDHSWLFLYKDCYEESSNLDCDYIDIFIRNSSLIGEDIETWYGNLNKGETFFGSGGIIEAEKTTIAQKGVWKIRVLYEYGVAPQYLIFNFEKGYVLDLTILYEPITNWTIPQHILDTLQFDN